MTSACRRTQAQHLGVLRRHDVEPQAVDPRQPCPVVRGAPVVRVADEVDGHARLVAGEHERPRAHHARRGRIGGPGGGERAGGNQARVAGARQDRQGVQRAETWAERRRVGQLDRLRIEGARSEGGTVHAQAVGERAAEARVMDRGEREDDVSGGDGRAVGEPRVGPEGETHQSPAVGDGPRGGQGRLERLRHVVHAHEWFVDELAHDERGAVTGEQAIEAARLGTQRCDQLDRSRVTTAAAGPHRSSQIPPKTTRRTRRTPARRFMREGNSLAESVKILTDRHGSRRPVARGVTDELV